MGSVAMIRIPSFIKTGSGILKIMGGYTDTHAHARTHAHTQDGDRISLLQESRLKRKHLPVRGTYGQYYMN
jgi:hypothetical protein